VLTGVLAGSLLLWAVMRSEPTPSESVTRLSASNRRPFAALLKRTLAYSQRRGRENLVSHPIRVADEVAPSSSAVPSGVREP